jgi:hypothetical protein
MHLSDGYRLLSALGAEIAGDDELTEWVCAVIGGVDLSALPTVYQDNFGRVRLHCTQWSGTYGGLNLVDQRV